jgi:hypothetical protein
LGRRKIDGADVLRRDIITSGGTRKIGSVEWSRSIKRGEIENFAHIPGTKFQQTLIDRNG